MVSTTTSTTTASATEYFDSADLYFEPDDPAVWNPEEFSPHQRLRSFLSRSSKLWHSHSHCNSLKTGNHHNPSGHGTSPAANRYFFTATPDKTTTPLHVVPHGETMNNLSESLASLARTSTSSSEDGPAQERKDDEECSLTYSVESERHLMIPFEEDDHQYLTAQPASRLRNGHDVYADDNDTGRNGILWFPVPPLVSNRDHSSKRDGCFQPRSESGKMECFHPLAWIGNAISLLIRTVEERKLEDTTR